METWTYNSGAYWEAFDNHDPRYKDKRNFPLFIHDLEPEVMDRFMRVTYEEMEKVRRKNETERIRKKVSDKLRLWDVPAAPDAPTDAAAISGDPNKLKAYLKAIIGLEAGIYSMTERLSPLYRNQERVQILRNRNRFLPVYQLQDTVTAAQRQLSEAKAKPVTYEAPRMPTKPAAPVLEKPGLFNKKKVEQQNAEATAQYEQTMKAYEAACAECNAETERRRFDAQYAHDKAVSRAETALKNAEDALSAKRSQAKAAPVVQEWKDTVDREVTEAETLLEKAYQSRNQLYGMDVIFGKYRNLVAVSTFYEYLMSGRCTKLEGTDGAYNIYEGEIRADRIIAQLDTVITKLDAIKDNQYVLYEKMSEINSNLSWMSDTMDKISDSMETVAENTATIAENSEQIAYNTAATAFYAKRNAELTDALGFMVALK